MGIGTYRRVTRGLLVASGMAPVRKLLAIRLESEIRSNEARGEETCYAAKRSGQIDDPVGDTAGQVVRGEVPSENISSKNVEISNKSKCRRLREGESQVLRFPPVS